MDCYYTIFNDATIKNLICDSIYWTINFRKRIILCSKLAFSTIYQNCILSRGNTIIIMLIWDQITCTLDNFFTEYIALMTFYFSFADHSKVPKFVQFLMLLYVMGQFFAFCLYLTIRISKTNA